MGLSSLSLLAACSVEVKKAQQNYVVPDIGDTLNSLKIEFNSSAIQTEEQIAEKLKTKQNIEKLESEINGLRVSKENLEKQINQLQIIVQKQSHIKGNIESKIAEIKILEASSEKLKKEIQLLDKTLQETNNGKLNSSDDVASNSADVLLITELIQKQTLNREKLKIANIKKIQLETELKALSTIKLFLGKDKEFNEQLNAVKKEIEKLEKNNKLINSQIEVVTLESKVLTQIKEMKNLKLAKEFKLSTEINGIIESKFAVAELNKQLDDADANQMALDKQNQELVILSQRIEDKEIEFEKNKIQNQNASQKNGKVEILELTQKIIDKLRNKEKITITELVDAIIERESIKSKDKSTTKESLKEDIKLLASFTNSNEISEIKVNYENALQNMHDGRDLILNNKYDSVSDIYLNNRVQSMTGSLNFLLINELRKNPAKNMIVVLTLDKIQPAYIYSYGYSKDLFVKAIETTKAGPAKINYGRTSTLKGDIAVFDAHQYLLINLIEDYISNYESVFSQMQKTMEKYGVDSSKIIQYKDLKKLVNENAKKSSSKVALGISKLKPGDHERVKSSEVELVDLNYDSRVSWKIEFKKTEELIKECETDAQIITILNKEIALENANSNIDPLSNSEVALLQSGICYSAAYERELRVEEFIMLSLQK